MSLSMGADKSARLGFPPGGLAPCCPLALRPGPRFHRRRLRIQGVEPVAAPLVAGRVHCVVLDCPDVWDLARFYQSLLGGEINRPDPRWAVGEDFSTLHTPALVLAFQRVASYQPPRWPDTVHPQQIHLDVEVPNLDEAHGLVLRIGATLLRADPRGWGVYADPAGHPFCLLRG